VRVEQSAVVNDSYIQGKSNCTIQIEAHLTFLTITNKRNINKKYQNIFIQPKPSASLT